MKSWIIIFAFLFACRISNGQGRNAIWCFGDSAGIDFRNTSSPVPFSSGLSAKGTCASISDSAGNLLFYCASPDIVNFNNGVLPLGIVYNKNHEKMINGDSLNCRAWYHEMVITTNPSNVNQYFIFHIDDVNLNGLYYSIVDMTLDNGRGKVISKNNQLSTDKAGDYLQAVKHGNGKDWWLIFRTAPPANNKFYVYSVNSLGVQLDHIDSVGQQSSSDGGDLRFNSDGSQFAFCNWNGLLAIYDFDRCSGAITLNKTIHNEFPAGTHPFFFDCCFSPNDSMLYVSCAPYYSSNDTNQIYVYQFRLWLSNIYASKLVVWNVPYPNIAGAVRLAPDNKIYIAAQSTGYPYDTTNYYHENMNLTVINQPNKVGPFASDIQPFSFYLGGKRTYWGLPNNPNYDLGPLAGSVCDTIHTFIDQPVISTPSLNLLFQKAWQSIIVNAHKLRGTNVRIYLTDISGRILLIENGKALSGYFTKNISVENFAAGIYLVTVVTEREKLARKVMIN